MSYREIAPRTLGELGPVCHNIAASYVNVSRRDGSPSQLTEGTPVKLKLTSIYVDDQEKALRFYTEVLGFVKKTEVPLGEHRWLTVVSPATPVKQSAATGYRCGACSSRDRTRTCDPLINSQLLYQLSYSGRGGRIGPRGCNFKSYPRALRSAGEGREVRPILGPVARCAPLGAFSRAV